MQPLYFQWLCVDLTAVAQGAHRKKLMVYKSKKDGWLILVLSLAGILPVVVGAFVLIATPVQLTGWLLIVTGIVVAVLLRWLMTPLYYEITRSQLNVRSGPLRWSIPLESVAEVYPTRSPLSSPALSLDRLAIRYAIGNSVGALLISPEDKTTFLHELESAEPRLKLVGNALKRS